MNATTMVLMLMATACSSATQPATEVQPAPAERPEVVSARAPDAPMADDAADEYDPFAGFDKPPNGGFESPHGRVPSSPPGPEAKVTVGDPTVHGTLDARWVATLIRRYTPGLKWCYVDRLQALPALAGELTLEFVVLVDGTTSAPRVAGRTLDDARLEACFLAKMARWRFTYDKPPAGTAKVTFTFGMRTEMAAPE